MSGILLPGQEREQKSEGKIELPKGYSSSREERASDETVAADIPAASSPPGAPSEPTESEQGQLDGLLFPPRGAQIACPACSSPYVVPVFSIIDLGVNPELKGPLLSGQVNVAVCQKCGAGGPLGAPLMVHDPEHEFLGVYVPAESSPDDLQRQKVIGGLTQTLMRKIPSESRRGYMLQAQQFMDWQRFNEKLWEFEGVTPAMLRKQRDQSTLLQSLVGLANDEKALEIAVERAKDLIDRDFFALLDQLVAMTRTQGQPEEAQQLNLLRQKLLDTTDAGRQVKARQEKIQNIIAQIQPGASREQLLELVLDAWKDDEDRQQIVGTLAVTLEGAFDYQFLMMLSERIGGAGSSEEREELEELRDFILQIQEQVANQQRQTQESTTQQAQALIQEILQATDPRTALGDNADKIDDVFLSMLAANIQSAEEKGAAAAARRLRQIYALAMEVVQERLPDDVQFLNKLLTAPDEATARQLLRENREFITSDFVKALVSLETEMRSNSRADLADRIKTLRGQMALML